MFPSVLQVNSEAEDGDGGGGEGPDDVVERDICYQRRKHEPRHEAEGGEERNIQGGWAEGREGVSGLSD